MTLWSRGPARSCDKLKPLGLLYYSAYDHLTWQGGDLPWGAPIVIINWSFYHMVLLDHVTNLKHYIATYDYQTWQGDDMLWRTPTQKVFWFFNHVVFRGHVTYKYFKSPLALDQWPPNMARWWLAMRGFQS